MPTPLVPERRRFERIALKKPASLVVSLVRLPCLVLDSSQGGFRLRAICPLSSGQVVEVIPDDDNLNAVRCKVVWVGKTSEVGLQPCGIETPMSGWVLACPECHEVFTYTEIANPNPKHVNVSKPKFPKHTVRRKCPHCHKFSRFERYQLVYRAI